MLKNLEKIVITLIYILVIKLFEKSITKEGYINVREKIYI